MSPSGGVLEGRPRCFGSHSPVYAHYHDTEWGVPCHDDQRLFEMLILEGAQAGLSWETILNKRQGYHAVFHGFDPRRVAAMSDDELHAAQQDARIVRNRLKIAATRKNAQVFLQLQDEHGGFSPWLWGHVDHQPVVTAWPDHASVPVQTPLAVQISKTLHKRGMRFVGPTIIYAYLQAVGVVNDHLATCWKSAVSAA